MAMLQANQEHDESKCFAESMRSVGKTSINISPFVRLVSADEDDIQTGATAQSLGIRVKKTHLG